jgi:dimethylhistidine N-methyltransferase
VLEGLSATPRTLPCKWLYDAEGSRLFEAITRLPEYYPTRTETAILSGCAAEVAAATGPGAVVVEFGAGAAEKVSLLLGALDRVAAYVPVDIAPAWLASAAARLRGAHPGLAVRPVLADFTRPFALPPRPEGAPVLGFFPGSTIGNFSAAGAEDFLRQARRSLGAGSALLLGADLVKDLSVLLPAYDDAAGVTAAFNLNILARLNRELGADFDLSGFRHAARWNAAEERIEMHLEALRGMEVRLGGQRFRFAPGETIRTEESHKYQPEKLAALCARAGWQVARHWTDPDRLFGVWLLRAAAAAAG